MPPSKQIRSAFTPHERFLTVTSGPSRTKQSFREESEINNIVARYQKTGILDHVAKYGGSYGSMPAAGDFHEAMNLVTEAQSMFEELPSSVRSRFANDPASFLEFVGDDENRDEMVTMGLLDAPSAAPAAAEEAPEPPTPGSTSDDPAASPAAP